MKYLKASTQEPQGEITERTLFAAANSGKGFYSFYDQIFNRQEIKRRYIIKGGPGTGKSSFMKEIAKYARGKGLVVEYYRCSSDPESLDGIVIDGRIAMLDGTSPHTVEPDCAGARDEIVNLGEFWDAELLANRYNDIVSISALKGNCYRKAYRFLSAAMEVEEINRGLVSPTVQHEKMKKAVRRLMRFIDDGKEFQLFTGLAASVGMKGCVRWSTYEGEAKRLYVIDDHYHTGDLFLSYLIDAAREKKCAVRVSYQPIMPSLPDAVLFLESGVCFVLGEHGGREADARINMKRFVDCDALTAIKTEYRVNQRLYDALLQSAIEALSEAGRYHFDLEQIYISCMDFDSEKKFLRSFCQKIGE